MFLTSGVIYGDFEYFLSFRLMVGHLLLFGTKVFAL